MKTKTKWKIFWHNIGERILWINQSQFFSLYQVISESKNQLIGFLGELQVKVEPRHGQTSPGTLIKMICLMFMLYTLAKRFFLSKTL